MLVLSRRIGEEILVGDDVRIRVLDVNGSRVRIGVDAPKEVPVHRAELMSAIREFRDPLPFLGEVGSGI